MNKETIGPVFKHCPHCFGENPNGYGPIHHKSTCTKPKVENNDTNIREPLSLGIPTTRNERIIQKRIDAIAVFIKEKFPVVLKIHEVDKEG